MKVLYRCVNQRCEDYDNVIEVTFPRVAPRAHLIGEVRCDCGWSMKSMDKRT